MLLEAASLGDEGAVARQLEQGAAIEDEDGDGWTGLVRAAAVGHEAVVRMLLGSGASVLPLFIRGEETARRQASRSARATPLHYKELFGEASIVNMLVAAAGAALPSAESESEARLLRSAEYGQVLLYLRALQPRANQKLVAARLAAQPTAVLQADAPYKSAKGAWSFSYDEFVRDAGESVARQVLLRGHPYPVHRILSPAPAPRPAAPPFKRSLPSNLVSEVPAPVHDPVRTGAHWYRSTDGAPTELEGVASVPTQMPETPADFGMEWCTESLPQQLMMSRHHPDLVIDDGSLAASTIVKRAQDSLWKSSRRKEVCVAIASSQMTEGRHYIECRVLASANSGFLIGVAESDYDPRKDPEFAGSMWAFDALDGSLFHAQRSFNWHGMEPSVQGDCIGVHLDSDRGLLTIYKNGRKLGVICEGLRGETLSWVVPLWDVGDCVQITPLSEPTSKGQELPLVDEPVPVNIDDAHLHLNCKENEVRRRRSTASSEETTRSYVANEIVEQQMAVSEEPQAVKELPDVQAQAILDAEAARARPQILQKLRNTNKQALLVARENTAENEAFLASNDRESPEHNVEQVLSVPATSAEAAQRGFKEEANFQLTRFLSFSEQGAVTLLIPKLSEICRKILSAMTTRQLVNLAQRRHVSAIDCPALTKLELQALVQKTAAVPEEQLYIDLDSVSKEFRHRLHYHHRSAAVTRPELMVFLKELGADPALYFDKQKLIKKLTEHWAGRELKRVMLSDKSNAVPRTGKELVKDPAALVLSRTEWVQKLERALGWIAPGTLFVSMDSQNVATVGLPNGEPNSPSESTDEKADNTTNAQLQLTASSSSVKTEIDGPVIGAIPPPRPSHMRSHTPCEDGAPSDTSSSLTGVETLERELRSLVLEAKNAAVTANTAAISIVKRDTDASQDTVKQQQPIAAAAAPLATTRLATDKDSSQSLEEVHAVVKRQEQQILRLTRQVEEVRVDLEHACVQQAAQPLLSAQVPAADACQAWHGEDREQSKQSDPLTEAEFRSAASRNMVSQLEKLKDTIDIDAADSSGTDHVFSKTALEGFTALHHAVFGEHGPSLDAMVLLLRSGCKTDVEDAAGITARGYAVDPRAASLLDLVMTPYSAQAGDPGCTDSALLPKLAPTMSSAEITQALISEVWPARLARAEQYAAVLEAAAVGDGAALAAALGPVGSTQDNAVNCTDGFGQTPLCWAAHQGHLSVVESLLQYNADIFAGALADTTDINPIAAVRGNFLSPRGTPFLNACRGGHHEIARLLSSGGVDRKQLEHALAEMHEREAHPNGANRWDVFCHWVPREHPESDADQIRIEKGYQEVKKLLKEIANMQGINVQFNQRNVRSKARSKPSTPDKASSSSRSHGFRYPRKTRSAMASTLPAPPVSAALTGPSSIQAMLLSPTTLGTLSDRRVRELASTYEQQALEAAQAAADSALAVAAFIKENGTAPPALDLQPKPPGEPQVDYVPRFTKLHRELRLSGDGQQVTKRLATTHGQWRSALCAGSKMVMRRGGGGVPEDYFADFTIRSASNSERKLGEVEGRSGLQKHPHHRNHHHHRALPRHVVIGVARRNYNPDTPGRGTSGQQCWGYCAHSGMCRHAGKTFDWGGSPAIPEACPGDTIGLHLRLPNESAISPKEFFQQIEWKGMFSKYDDNGIPTRDGSGKPLTKNARKDLVKRYRTYSNTIGGTLSVFLNGEPLGKMCDVPPGEYVWMVENGDPGESVTVRAGNPPTPKHDSSSN